MHGYLPEAATQDPPRVGGRWDNRPLIGNLQRKRLFMLLKLLTLLRSTLTLNLLTE